MQVTVRYNHYQSLKDFATIIIFALVQEKIGFTSSKYFGRLKMTQKTMVGIMYRMTRLQGWLAAATTAKWYSTGLVTARYLSTASTTVVTMEHIREIA